MVLRRKCPGLKHDTEAVGFQGIRLLEAVGKRSNNRRSRAVKRGGGIGNEDAGISSDNED